MVVKETSITLIVLGLLLFGCVTTPDQKEPETNATINITSYSDSNVTIEITGVVLPVDTPEEVYQIATQSFGFDWDKNSVTEHDYSWSIQELCDLFRPQECTYTQLSIDKETGNIIGLAIQ